MAGWNPKGNWKLWAGGVVLVLAFIFFLQNNDPVVLQILFWQTQASQLLVLPGLLVIGFVLGLVVGRYWWRSPLP